jgi:UDP-N-acetylglucosamine 2-epimerase (non-hydrolysing)
MKSNMKIIHVAGARPNFMKISPLIRELKKFPEFKPMIVHTGQHYDYEMSKLFFEELEIPEPDMNLEVGSASHAIQTAEIMKRFEKVVLEEKPDLVVVVGDVNSTIACALTSVKLGIRVAHVEAGLRSFDRTMPEEINRILTDTISDFLFTSEQSGNVNLKNEGIPDEKVYFVGNVMIDTLLRNREKSLSSKILDTLSLKPEAYAALTLHRPSNVDDQDTFKEILQALLKVQKSFKIVFPIHPRTKATLQAMKDSHLLMNAENFIMTEPLGYLDFLRLMDNARFVLTDSGGIQEETTVLGIPCITLRKNTERPVTVSEGTNVIAGPYRDKIIEESLKVIEGDKSPGRIPEKWDGKASERIVKVLSERLSALH